MNENQKKARELIYQMGMLILASIAKIEKYAKKEWKKTVKQVKALLGFKEDGEER